MKEIIYIQAGSLANYTAQHFWNTQEAYFTYGDGDNEGEEQKEPLVDHDISFREGVSPKSGDVTYCPRALIFDWKGNFGALRPDLYDDAGEEEEIRNLWNGDVVEYRQEQIPKSKYQEELEFAGEDVDRSEDDGRERNAEKRNDSDIRFWSDYSRVYYHPRSLQKLAEPADWQDPEGDWNYGQDLFRGYDHENDLMDDTLRHFMEECDALQGIQLINDSSSFGAFVDSMLTLLKDDHPKLTCLTFPFLSSVVPGEALDNRAMRIAINDALCIRDLKSLSTLSVPLQSSSLWNPGAWSSDLQFDNTYRASAILASHIESATLPLRTKGSVVDLRDLCDSVTYPSNVPFAHLSGALPVPIPITDAVFDERMHDFSKVDGADRPSTVYARRDVSRGFTGRDRIRYDAWQEKSGIPITLYDITHAPALPIPTSFPGILRDSSLPPSPTAGTARCLSSLYSSSATSEIFSVRASFIDDCIKRKRDMAGIVGIEIDELRELANDLWAMHDAYHDEGDISEEGLEEEHDDEEE
ncbi:tubulin nucleotide-binding domain-like protein [Heliocybe sulcata]|uniref:Tubulin nucleotide-binding domain-like protein n=1 Tax=Heliocybe sulcata TaxID=5364 RepID=A0A5C3MYN0_9AGAM|nr:tubulin nucleotide-binding domain-like protein [Heliocybe sulcata]